MNAGQLHTLLQYELDDTIEFAKALEWFNACSDELAGVARVRATSSNPTWTGGDTYTLPADLVTLVEVRYRASGDQDFTELKDLNLYPFDRTGYRRWGDTLRFSEALGPGTIEIDYHRTLGRLTGTESVPEIPEQFHMAYVHFAVVRWHRNLSNDDAVQRADKAERDFFVLKVALDLHTREEGQEGPIRTRDVLPKPARRSRRVGPLEDWVKS